MAVHRYDLSVIEEARCNRLRNTNTRNIRNAPNQTKQQPTSNQEPNSKPTTAERLWYIYQQYVSSRRRCHGSIVKLVITSDFESGILSSNLSRTTTLFFFPSLCLSLLLLCLSAFRCCLSRAPPLVVFSFFAWVLVSLLFVAASLARRWCARPHHDRHSSWHPPPPHQYP